MLRIVTIGILVIGSFSILAGCGSADNVESTTAEPEEVRMLAIQGDLTYRERIALPPDSRAMVELRDASVTEGPVITKQRIDLEGRQVPIPFELTVDRAELIEGTPYQLQGAIFSAGRPTWITDPIAIDPAAEVVDLGMLVMTRFTAEAFRTTLQCGVRKITIGHTEEGLRLTVGDEAFDLRPVAAASGAKYAELNDPSTTFWSKGDRALLEIRGQAYPECMNVDSEEQVFLAAGNEPSWVLEIGDQEMTLLTNYGENRLAAPTPVPEATGDGKTYVANVDGKNLTVTISARLCTDTMSGMPHPNTVVVRLDDKTLHGCGGEPAALVRGAEWVVEDLNGGGIIDRSRVTLNFDADGRVFGNASCNTYNGGYVLTGEGLTLSRAATTMMACAPALMTQESRFFELLERVERFEISPDGALILHTDDLRTIAARRL
mgnify:CR=1 FL=1